MPAPLKTPTLLRAARLCVRPAFAPRTLSLPPFLSASRLTPLPPPPFPTSQPPKPGRAAIAFGLHSLTPADEFTVVAFDHEQAWFSPGLLPATPQNVAACGEWVRCEVHPRGMTDIMTPLRTALSVLAARGGAGPSGQQSLPFVFLVTDGCVHDERQICRFLEQQNAALMAPASGPEGGGFGAPGPRGLPRVCTFGIGTYCNHFFLRQLATSGRGAFDVAFRAHAIQVRPPRRPCVVVVLPLCRALCTVARGGGGAAGSVTACPSPLWPFQTPRPQPRSPRPSGPPWLPTQTQMQRMLTAAQRPVLSDVTLTLPGVAAAELYPYPLVRQGRGPGLAGRLAGQAHYATHRQVV